MRDIGKNIKDLRCRRGMTQEEMAERLFVTRQTISNYETGKSRPDVEMIVKIGDLFGVDANTVIYGSANEKKQNYRRLLIGAVIMIVSCALLILLNKWVTLHRANTYLCFLYSVIKLIVDPAAFVAAGWWLVDAVSTFLEFKRPNHPIISYVCTAVICLLSGILIFVLPQVVFDAISDYFVLQNESFSLSFPYIPLFSEIERFLVISNLKFPAVYMAFGVILRMTGFSSKK